MKPIQFYFFSVFISYLAALRLIFDHWRSYSLSHQIFITAVLLFRPLDLRERHKEVRSQSSVVCSMEFEPVTLQLEWIVLILFLF